MLSIEEWTKEHIKYITKTQIKKVYDILDIPCEKLYNTTKNELLLEIQYDNINYSDIYNNLKDEQFGISVTGVSEQLGVTKYRVNKLINDGIFNVIYERINNNYGKAVKCKFIKYEDVYNYYLKNIRKVLIMCDKVKIQNNGDWICPKCEAQNSEHKDNIKRIDYVLCDSCYEEFKLDKEENQNNEITIERDCCSNTVSVKVNDRETYIMVEDGVSAFVDGIQAILSDLNIKSRIIS